MAGRDEVFKHIYCDYGSTVLSVCRSFSENSEDCKDLYQETLFRIWKGLRTYRGDSSLGTWVYRVTVNTCLDDWRQRSRKKGLHFNGFANWDDIPDGSSSIVDDLIVEEELALFHSYLRQLPPIDRAIVSLYLEDISNSTIAGILGISESNVAVRFHRAKRRLANLYREEVG